MDAASSRLSRSCWDVGEGARGPAPSRLLVREWSLGGPSQRGLPRRPRGSCSVPGHDLPGNTRTCRGGRAPSPRDCASAPWYPGVVARVSRGLAGVARVVALVPRAVSPVPGRRRPGIARRCPGVAVRVRAPRHRCLGNARRCPATARALAGTPHRRPGAGRSLRDIPRVSPGARASGDGGRDRDPRRWGGSRWRAGASPRCSGGAPLRFRWACCRIRWAPRSMRWRLAPSTAFRSPPNNAKSLGLVWVHPDHRLARSHDGVGAPGPPLGSVTRWCGSTRTTAWRGQTTVWEHPDHRLAWSHGGVGAPRRLPGAVARWRVHAHAMARWGHALACAHRRRPSARSDRAVDACVPG